jgi:hypothetical protein|tara:strand:+ start:264 stop:1007 length:744 start_codon:yes stop_codon:yes gene_type:complete
MKKFILLLSLIIFSCEDNNNDLSTDLLKIVNPVSDETVSENVNIVVEYEGDKTLSTVRYIFNDELLTDVNNYPFVYTWNTLEWTNGSYYLYAIGYFNEQDSILSNTVSGQIYNEVPSDPLIIFDTSQFYPEYKGYKYNYGYTYNVCGETSVPYCYLVFTVAVKNIGGLPAYNVRVQLSAIVNQVIGGYPSSNTVAFSTSINLGTIQPGETAGDYANTSYSCNYGPGNAACFEDLSLDDITTNITWSN